MIIIYHILNFISHCFIIHVFIYFHGIKELFAPLSYIFLQTQRERVAAARAELAAREAERPFTLPDNDRDMVRLWHKLDRRVAAGAELAGREL